MKTTIDERVDEARRGANPYVICRMPSGWCVVGDHQVVAGYCLLLPDPVVGSINDLNEGARSRFLLDMVRIGDALLAETDSWRINYEILGNKDPALHAHIFPRYMDEHEMFRYGPVFNYDLSSAEPTDLSSDEVQGLMRSLRDRLTA